MNVRIVINNILISFFCWLNCFCVLLSCMIFDCFDGVGEMIWDVWLLLFFMIVVFLMLNVFIGVSFEDVEGVVFIVCICNLKL